MILLGLRALWGRRLSFSDSAERCDSSRSGSPPQRGTPAITATSKTDPIAQLWIRVFDPAQEWSRNSRAISHFLCAHFAVEPADANHLGQYFESFEVLAGMCAMCWFRHHVTEEHKYPNKAINGIFMFNYALEQDLCQSLMRNIKITLNIILEYICSIALHAHLSYRARQRDPSERDSSLLSIRNYRSGQAYNPAHLRLLFSDASRSLRLTAFCASVQTPPQLPSSALVFQTRRNSAYRFRTLC